MAHFVLTICLKLPCPLCSCLILNVSCLLSLPLTFLLPIFLSLYRRLCLCLCLQLCFHVFTKYGFTCFPKVMSSPCFCSKCSMLELDQGLGDAPQCLLQLATFDFCCLSALGANKVSHCLGQTFPGGRCSPSALGIRRERPQ